MPKYVSLQLARRPIAVVGGTSGGFSESGGEFGGGYVSIYTLAEAPTRLPTRPGRACMGNEYLCIYVSIVSIRRGGCRGQGGRVWVTAEAPTGRPPRPGRAEKVRPSAAGRCRGRMQRRTRGPPRSGTRMVGAIHTSWCKWSGPPNDLRETRTRGKLTHEWGGKRAQTTSTPPLLGLGADAPHCMCKPSHNLRSRHKRLTRAPLLRPLRRTTSTWESRRRRNARVTQRRATW
eukprot:scaffold29043_cov112-Isochrysis_galbana.AAC.1